MEEHLLDKMNREHFNNQLVIVKPYFDGPYASCWKIGVDIWGDISWSPINPDAFEMTQEIVEELQPRLKQWVDKVKKEQDDQQKSVDPWLVIKMLEKEREKKEK